MTITMVSTNSNGVDHTPILITVLNPAYRGKNRPTLIHNGAYSTVYYTAFFLI
jgi:hypothetical protein